MSMYVKEEKVTDFQTGEVVAREEIRVSKQTKEEYVRIYLKTIEGILAANLTATEHNILYALQKYTTNNSNLLFYNAEVRKIIANELGIKPDTVRRAVQKFVKKGLVVREGRLYYLNPLHFGRGDWQNIRKLRKTLVLDFDFENLRAAKQEGIATFYVGEDELKEELENAHKENRLLAKVDVDNKKITKEVEIIDEAPIPVEAVESDDDFFREIEEISAKLDFVDDIAEITSEDLKKARARKVEKK